MERATLGLVSAALTASCAIPYLRQVACGRVRPQRTSWFVFATMSIIAAVAQVQQSADAGAWFAVGSAVGFGTIFLVSLWRGVGGRSVADLATLSVAGVSALLLIAGYPLAATVGIIVAEIAATALTVRKASLAPHEEAVSSWSIDAVAGLVAILAVTRPSVTELLYPIHSTALNLWVIVAVMAARRTLRRHPLAVGA